MVSSRGLKLQTETSLSRYHHLDRPITDVWRRLSHNDSFLSELVRATLNIADGRTTTSFLDHITQAGIQATDANLPMLLVRMARGETPAYFEFLRVVRDDLGRGRSSTDDIFRIIRLFELSDRTPTFHFRIEDSFFNLRADQQEDLCDLLAQLANGCDVRIVGSSYQLRRLADRHRTRLPGVSGPISTPLSVETHDPEQVADAIDALDPDGRPFRILADLEETSTQTAPFAKLYAIHSHVTRARVRQAIGELVDLNLVSTFGPMNNRFVELLPLGRDVLDTVREEIGIQQRLQTSVSETGNSQSQYTCRPGTALEPSTQPDPQRKLGGLAESAYLSRWSSTATAAVADAGDIILVNRSIERSTDSREYEFWYDAAVGRAYVSVEYSRVHQYWGTTARALVERLDQVLPLDEIDAQVLDEYPLAVLRDGRNLGYLSSEMDGAAYVDAIRDEFDRIMEMLVKWRHQDYEDAGKFYGELVRAQKGLVYTIVHLLDLAGIEVVLDVRVPDWVLKDADHRYQLLRTITHAVTIQSVYKDRVAYRQLFEQRADRRRAAFSVDVDASDPHGEVIGSIVLSGPRVAGLEADLESWMEDPEPLHEDAPEFDVNVTIAKPGSRAYKSAIRGMCEAKNMDSTPAAEAIIEAFVTDPYAATYALHHLGSEDRRREIRVGEVRYALSQLPWESLIAGEVPSIRKIVKALLEAPRRLSQAELGEAADVSTRTIRNHAERLEAFGFVSVTSKGYRLRLSFNDDDERYREILPLYTFSVRLSLLDIVREVESKINSGADYLNDPPPSYVALCHPPDREQLEAAWSWIGPWMDRSERLLGLDLPAETSIVTFGSPVEQTSIGTVVMEGERAE